MEEQGRFSTIEECLREAIQREVSDIHLEPDEQGLRIRFRLNGLLMVRHQLSLSQGLSLSTQIKVMAQLDIAEKRLPQDGRFRVTLPHKSVDCRVSSCPSLYGEKLVIRILDPHKMPLNIDFLGLSASQQELFLNTLKQPQGMILVTGPTGSGKTISLYTAVNLLNQPERNISSCEDPIEIQLPGINQVNVNLKAGLNFASILRALLRQDPDVILIGEIRDLETAEIAVKAAQTGHLVLSTLHTNSAAAAITRLIHLGIQPYMLVNTLSLIIAQRLVRTLCSQCKIPDELPPPLLYDQGFSKEELPDLTLFKAAGCSECQQGYAKRLGIFELIPMTETLEKMILIDPSSTQIRNLANLQGHWNLRRAGLNLVKSGATSLNELNRVLVA